MASASRQFYLFLSRTAAFAPLKRPCQHFTRHTPIRTLSTTRAQWIDQRQPPSDTSNVDIDPSELQTPTQPLKPSDLDHEQRATYDAMPSDEQTRYMALQNHLKAVFEAPDLADALDTETDAIIKRLDRELPDLDFREERNLRGIQAGYWAEDEDDEFGQLPDDDDASDDSHISSIAESELEVHRELREYHRIAAWELPLLSKFARPFVPPTYATPLRFRYTTYMGESHPAARKVVCEFTSRDIAVSASLSDTQRIKLLKLVGVRYNPATDTIKMSCEKFEDAAQNKRYLGDLVTKLLAEAKDMTDTFEDVPLDLRHVKTKKQYTFPEEWKVTPRTVQKLLEKRSNTKMLPDPQARPPVDGEKLVEEYVTARGMMPGMITR